MICLLQCVPTTQSHIIFCHHVFGPLPPLLLPTHFPLLTTTLLSVCGFWFYILHMSEIIWLLAFSLSTILSRFIPGVTNGSISSFLMAEWYATVSMYNVFIQCSIEGHSGYFHVLAIVNHAAMNREVRISLHKCFQNFQVDIQKRNLWVLG